MVKSIKIEELVKLVSGKIIGIYDKNTQITGTSSIEGYIKNRVTFVRDEKYEKKLTDLDGAVVIIPDGLTTRCIQNSRNTYIVVHNVEDSIIDLQNFFYGETQENMATNISPSAWIAKSSKIGDGVYIGNNVYIGENVTIGDQVKIMPNAFIDNCVVIGKRTIIKPFVTCENCSIGEDTIIRTGTHIGEEGFRYTQDIEAKKVYRVIHSGNVVIGNRVIIGANSSIQRSTFEGKPTTICDDVKIASMVLISHNVTIGPRTIVISETMVGGSVTIGEDVWIGMGVVIAQGLRIGDRAKLLINAVVVRDVPDNEIVSGFYAMPHRQWEKAYKKLLEFGIE